MKEYNARQHYKRNHERNKNLEGDIRDEKTSQLESGLLKQMNIVTNHNNDSERSVKLCGSETYC